MPSTPYFDWVLLAALVFTAALAGRLHWDLRRLRGYHREYQDVFQRTAEAADRLAATLGALKREGFQPAPQAAQPAPAPCRDRSE